MIKIDIFNEGFTIIENDPLLYARVIDFAICWDMAFACPSSHQINFTPSYRDLALIMSEFDSITTYSMEA